MSSNPLTALVAFIVGGIVFGFILFSGHLILQSMAKNTPDGPAKESVSASMSSLDVFGNMMELVDNVELFGIIIGFVVLFLGGAVYLYKRISNGGGG